MPSDEWPVEHQGMAFQPIPEAWVANGLDDPGAAPRLLAVSVARSKGHVHVRYLHPEVDAVGVRSWPICHDDELGWVPRPYIVAAWPRSLPQADVEPVAEATLAEREHASDVWSGYLADALGRDDIDDGELVADGGVVDDSLMGYKRRCPVCERMVGAADRFCSWCGESLRGDGDE